MKPEDELEPSTPEFEEGEGEEETPEVDEIAQEIYDEENHDFVLTVENTPPFILDLMGRDSVMSEVRSKLEKLTILAARAGVGTFEGGVRKPELSEGAFAAHVAIAIPQGVLERKGVTWEEFQDTFDKGMKIINDWVDEKFADSSDEDDEE